MIEAHEAIEAWIMFSTRADRDTRSNASLAFSVTAKRFSTGGGSMCGIMIPHIDGTLANVFAFRLAR